MTRREYRLRDGTRVPSVTQVVGCFRPDDSLTFWANQLGLKGIDYRQELRRLADAGSLAHELVQSDIDDCEMPSLEGCPDFVASSAFLAFDAYCLWREKSGCIPYASEISCVSEAHRFGGTVDALGMLDGRRVLLDWKTGKRLFPSQVLQIGGYSLLLEETHPTHPIDVAMIIRLSREGAGYRTFRLPADLLAEARRGFLKLRVAYAAIATLKRSLTLALKPALHVPATQDGWDAAQDLATSEVIFDLAMSEITLED